MDSGLGLFQQLSKMQVHESRGLRKESCVKRRKKLVSMLCGVRGFAIALVVAVRRSKGISMGLLSGLAIAFVIHSVDRSLFTRLRDLYRTHYSFV